MVRNKMDETGVDLYIDVHGDEEIPFNFLAGAYAVVDGRSLTSRTVMTVMAGIQKNQDSNDTVNEVDMRSLSSTWMRFVVDLPYAWS